MKTCLSCDKEVTGRKKYCPDCIKERQRAAGRRYRKNGAQNPHMARYSNDLESGVDICSRCQIKFDSGPFTRNVGNGECAYCAHGLSKVRLEVMV